MVRYKTAVQGTTSTGMPGRTALTSLVAFQLARRKQETVLILLEKDPDKILKMHQQGYLRFRFKI